MKAVNIRKDKYTVYIGRGSVFGNPFKIGIEGATREQVIKEYEDRVREEINNTLGQRIYNLPEDAILGCYCKPQACHGDIIIKIWKEMHHVA